MAPSGYLIDSVQRSSLSRRSSTPASSSLSLGMTIGIGVGIAAVCGLALVAFVYLHYARRKQRNARVRQESWNAMESGEYSTKPLAPRKGFGRVLSVFVPKRRQPRGDPHTPSSPTDLSRDEVRPRQLPDKHYEASREPAVELEGGLVEARGSLFAADNNRPLSPFEDTPHGPMSPLYNSLGKLEQDVSSVGHYRPEDKPTLPSIRNLDMNSLVINTNAPPAAWHQKRTGPPPPLTIEPPGMHVRSPSDAYSAYSTYGTAHSAYTYCTINVPEVPPLPSHIPSDDFGLQFPYDGTPANRASTSNNSSHPFQYPPSPETPGSIPSMSRSDSGAQESFSLAPPTPTYAQPQAHAPSSSSRIPDDATFECLGPLPANMPIPSPPHFRTTHQQQQDPFLTPQASSSSLMTSSDKVEVAYTQDPLLHETNPFRPHHTSPVRSTFADSTTATNKTATTTTTRSSRDPRRRESSDSLGSNFTVEEEARIQAQIVKNLDALDKERVMDEDDIVHIPQISERRYSWEE